MNFSSDTIEKIEVYLEGNQDFCKKQICEVSSKGLYREYQILI